MLFPPAALERAMTIREVVLRRARGRHRRRPEPRPCFGGLLHLDGSRHPWLALVPEQRQTLLAIVDDATKHLSRSQT
jgi:hypothetical protein